MLALACFVRRRLGRCRLVALLRFHSTALSASLLAFCLTQAALHTSLIEIEIEIIEHVL